MSNIIGSKKHSLRHMIFSMSNQGSDCFFELLVLSSKKIKKTSNQKRIISFIKKQREINVYAPGTAGFDIEDLPWNKSTIEMDKDFLIEITEIAKQDAILDNNINDSIIIPWLEQFQKLIEIIS